MLYVIPVVQYVEEGDPTTRYKTLILIILISIVSSTLQGEREIVLSAAPRDSLLSDCIHQKPPDTPSFHFLCPASLSQSVLTRIYRQIAIQCCLLQTG